MNKLFITSIKLLSSITSLKNNKFYYFVTKMHFDKRIMVFKKKIENIIKFIESKLLDINPFS